MIVPPYTRAKETISLILKMSEEGTEGVVLCSLYCCGLRSKPCTRGLRSVLVAYRPLLLLFPRSSRLVSRFQKVDQPLHLTWSSAHYSPLSCLALNGGFFAGTLIYSLNLNSPQRHKRPAQHFVLLFIFKSVVYPL